MATLLQKCEVLCPPSASCALHKVASLSTFRKLSCRQDLLPEGIPGLYRSDASQDKQACPWSLRHVSPQRGRQLLSADVRH